MTKRPRFRVLSEETVRRGTSDDEGAINPYWLDEEPEPHPDPSQGCIRRGICCKTSPGWFGPGEVEAAAALKGETPDAFVRKYLVIDTQEVDGEVVHVFAPVKLARDGKPAIPPATRVDTLYRTLRGTCVFFTGEGCGIYAARPIECARFVCTNAPEDNLSHAEIGRLWRDAAHEAASEDV